MTLGPAHHDLAVTFNNLAGLYHMQRRYADAAEAFKAIASLHELMLGPHHADVGTALNNVGEAYRAQGRPADAQLFFRRAIAIWEKALGSDHTLVAVALDNLGLSFQAEGREIEAQSLYKRALAVREKALGPDHPEVGRSLHNLAALAFGQRDWARAADLWRRSTSVIIRRIDRRTSGPRIGQRAGEKARGEVERSSHWFWSLAKAVYRLESQGREPDLPRTDEMFQTAQWATASEAAHALAQMAARGAKGNPALAVLVRERQDLVDKWLRRDAARSAAVAQPPDKRDRESEAANSARLAEIDARMASIDQSLATDFPDYASFVGPAPLSLAEVQAQLGPNEALVLFLDTPELGPAPEETFVWVVTKTAARWVRSDLGSTGLAREVTALRCGLDEYAWEGAGARRCREALRLASVNATPRPLPFDHARAHKLYNSLFGAVEGLIKGKHLLIVPSGALTQLPFHVLVTEDVKPAGSDATAPNYRAVSWLARAHAITILPAVASLKALRRVGRPSAAPRPMIGFGNPLLDGPDWRYAMRARLARTKPRCPETIGQRLAAAAGLRGGVARVETRGGLADLAHIKMQVPLPETADELCAVAQDLKAAGRDIRIGRHATEREVKRLSASGELAKYRIVHFATHGALAGELEGTREPGLILTPPEAASAEDDGYLSASEIAGLKLDADWVILSACNTAAGGADSAEALSGLARAFIYAQARALLVSHWAVDSNATVKLVTAAVAEMARDARVGRADAMRRSMLALIDKGEPYEAHPALWAPFVVVGEGAPDR
jgi:CHAT domain-containing protein/tetratricopeptide (TPR) repeat protein